MAEPASGEPGAETPDDRPADQLSVEELRAKLRQAELEAGRMPFFEHLRELRTRLRNAIIALIGGFAIAYTFKEEIFLFLTRPLTEVWGKLQAANPEAISEIPALHFTGLVEPFWTYFSIAFWAGIFVASPFIFHQIWKFIAPGLYKNERRLGIVFGVASAFFFISGAAFCYTFVLEAVYEFLLSYSSANLAEMSRLLGEEEKQAAENLLRLAPMLTMGEYLSFAKKILIGFGLAFELPLVIFFLSLTGVVTHRSLWRYNRWAAVAAFVLAAALTPPDIVSQTMLAGPLVVLYNFSILIAFFVTRSREAKEAALMGDAEGEDESDAGAGDDESREGE
jgi:sec-independent protein translocase protein TatC